MDSKPSNHPLVSVIMPAYNTATTLEEAVLSIIKQTYQNWEILLLVEPSTDNTLEIAEKLCEKEGRVKLFINEKNLGPAGNRNKGLKNAKGKYIAILDADDVAYPERLAKQVAFLESNSEIFLVGSGITRIDWDGTEQRSLKPAVLNSDDIAAKLPENNQFTHSSVMYRNEGKLEYREKIFYGEDYDFFLRVLSEGKKMANLPEPLVKYRSSMSSITFNSHSWEVQKKLLELIKQWYNERVANGNDSYGIFDPKQFKTQVESLSQEELAWQKIRVAMRANNQEAVRGDAWKYLKTYKPNLKVVGALVYSFIPRKLLHIIKHLIRKDY